MNKSNNEERASIKSNEKMINNAVARSRTSNKKPVQGFFKFSGMKL